MPTGSFGLVLVVAWVLLCLNGVANLLYFVWVGRRNRLPDTWPRLSVLIPARNEATNLTRLLPTLTTQDYPDFEIVLYDDASTDGTSDVARALGGDRMRVLAGDGPPPGWLGKPHACFRAAEAATGTVLLFLDADTAWQHPGALRRLVARHLGLPAPGVLTALPQFAGGGLLLVSMLGVALLFLPLALGNWLKWKGLGALNGQCWLVEASLYRRLQPHAEFRHAIVEDVEIGRWLLGQGIVPWATVATRDLTVWMYDSLPAARLGFQKNFYLVSGHSKILFGLIWAGFAWVLLIGPLMFPAMLLVVFGAKFLTDRAGRLPWWLWVFAPLTFLLALGTHMDSAIAHWRGKVMWKGRSVLD